MRLEQQMTVVTHHLHQLHALAQLRATGMERVAAQLCFDALVLKVLWGLIVRYEHALKGLRGGMSQLQQTLHMPTQNVVIVVLVIV